MLDLLAVAHADGEVARVVGRLAYQEQAVLARPQKLLGIETSDLAVEPAVGKRTKVVFIPSLTWSLVQKYEAISIGEIKLRAIAFQTESELLEKYRCFLAVKATDLIYVMLEGRRDLTGSVSYIIE